MVALPLVFLHALTANPVDTSYFGTYSSAAVHSEMLQDTQRVAAYRSAIFSKS
jgi:hypothetical protein